MHGVTASLFYCGIEDTGSRSPFFNRRKGGFKKTPLLDHLRRLLWSHSNGRRSFAHRTVVNMTLWKKYYHEWQTHFRSTHAGRILAINSREYMRYLEQPIFCAMCAVDKVKAVEGTGLRSMIPSQLGTRSLKIRIFRVETSGKQGIEEEQELVWGFDFTSTHEGTNVFPPVRRFWYGKISSAFRSVYTLFFVGWHISKLHPKPRQTNSTHEVTISAEARFYELPLTVFHVWRWASNVCLSLLSFLYEAWSPSMNE